jgi:hypothetical protein
MKPFLVSFACGAALQVTCASAVAGPTPQRAALCVAALKLRADALTARLDPKEPQIEAELTRVLEHGFAFIGDAYLHGMRDKEKADAMLHAAEQAQVGLPPAQMAQRQAGCMVEAQRLIAEAGSVGRLVVAHAAKKRLTRLKQKQKPL